MDMTLHSTTNQPTTDQRISAETPSVLTVSTRRRTDVPPLLSVIIVNWNTRDLTAECLESLQQEAIALAVAHGVDIASVVEAHSIDEQSVFPLVETIVVDNASSDGSVPHLRQLFPWIHLLENQTNVGFAAANNQGLAHARGTYLLLLNSDTKVLPGALRELIDFMENNPHAGAAGARYLNPDGSLQPSCYPAPTVARELWRLFHLDKFYPFGVYHAHKWTIDEPRLVDTVQGAAFFVRRTIAVELGLFDTDYFMYTEEVDLCRRIRQAGWQIFWVPRAVIIHYGGQSTRQIAQTMFLELYRSKILYFRKHHGRRATLLYKTVLLAATLVRLVLTPLAWTQSAARRQQSLILANHYRHLASALPAM